MSASDWLENKLLNHIFGNGGYSNVGIYIGLGLITVDATPNELSEIYNYTRVVTSTAYWTHAGNGQIVNTLGIVFPQAIGGDWGPVTHFILFQSGTYGAGNMLLYGLFTPELEVEENDVLQFEKGDLAINLD